MELLDISAVIEKKDKALVEAFLIRMGATNMVSDVYDAEKKEVTNEPVQRKLNQLEQDQINKAFAEELKEKGQDYFSVQGAIVGFIREYCLETFNVIHDQGVSHSSREQHNASCVRQISVIGKPTLKLLKLSKSDKHRREFIKDQLTSSNGLSNEVLAFVIHLFAD